MDAVLLTNLRIDSLSKHDGATKKYGSLPLESCKTVLVNRQARGGPTQVAFEEMDGWCHGINVDPSLINEDHIGPDKVVCPRCGGPGKLTVYGDDCTECSGTGMVNKV